MINNLKARQFEIPYNFDKNLIFILQYLSNNNIYAFYVPPFYEDYIAIPRNNYNENYYELSKTEYMSHLQFITQIFPNKIQLILQRKNQILTYYDLKKYFDIGVNKFIVANIEQAKIIKNLLPSADITGSIVMHINIEKIKNNNFHQYFNNFVLDFSYNRSLNKIQNLPTNFNYHLLINSYCNIQCKGDQHWFKKKDEDYYCPGLYLKHHNNFNETCLIRPMDLYFFDPYIKVYKLQDRGWTTQQIIYDYILYNSNFTIYPNIEYNINLYKK